ncbi:SDR family NAD(P)-dependent oxidoreductase [Pseudonocardia sp. CA-107938]|uniref:SDR family NAD(P)-dependent oxidoreductase n=1 Tax=Pseudonocardia sp. CA-107938 TaxID=3240021 RepID=UPI003D905FA2
MADRFRDKVVVITGTGAGQARTAALRFAAEGALVVGCDVDGPAANETERLVRAAGGTIECLPDVDLTVESEAERVMGFAADRFGGIDVLYNNATRWAGGSPTTMDPDAFRWTITNVLDLSWLATKRAYPYMRDRDGASIVFIGSIAGIGGWTGFPGGSSETFAYGCAKAAVIRMASVLAIELAPIRVNVVSPGPIRTVTTEPVFGEPGTPFHALYRDGMLVDRIGEPDDVVSAAMFLTSSEASWVTGQHLAVDGGFLGSHGAGRPDPAVTGPIAARFSGRATRASRQQSIEGL